MAAANSEVVRLIDEALNQLEDTERESLRARAMVVKGKAISEESPEDAARIFRDALRLDPGLAEVRFHLAHLYLERNQSARALATLEELSPEELSSPFLALKARILGVLGEETLAAEMIAAARSAALPVEYRHDLLLDLGEIALNIGRLDLAEDLLAEASAVDDSFALWALRGRLARKRGGFEDAVNSYDRAVVTAPAEQQSGVRGEYAAMLLQANDPTAAAAILRPIPEAQRSEAINKLLARSLYSAAQYAEASRVVDGLLQEGQRHEWLLEIASLLALRRDDLDAAKLYLERLLEFDPFSPSALIRLAQLSLRRRESEAAIAALERLDSSKLSASEKMQVAHLRMMYGLPGALEFAYAAVREDPRDPDLQLAYINVFLQREDALDELEPERVGIETAVTLKDEKTGERLSYSITSFESLPGRGDELQPTDPFAQRLIGLAIGDKITVREQSITEGILIVEEVRHAYVEMFQWLLRTFPTQNPEHIGLQSFKIGDQPSIGDFDPILRSVHARAEHIEKLYDIYQERGVPLGFLATAIGESIKNTFEWLTSDPEHWLYVQSGLPSDLARGRIAAAAAQHKPTVLTMTALLTLERLGQLSLLKSRLYSCVVPQSLLDEIHQEMHELEQKADRGGAKSIGKGDAGITFHETSPESLRAEANRLRRIEALLHEVAEIRPRPLDALSEEAEGIREALGASSFDAYKLAGPDAGILADDKGLLDLVRNERGGNGFNTYWLLQDAREAAAIGEDAFFDAVMLIIQWRHQFVPVSADLLSHALKSTGFQVNATVVTVLERLSGDHSDTDSAARVIAGLLRAVALSPAAGQLKAVAASAFERYLEGRPIEDGIHRLIRSLQMHFSLLPRQLSELIQVLSSVEAAKRRS